ncbi:MarR family winged helix-turn-helix transcriptional regulator [Hyphococcus luteus]|uniref:MarR family transcriptional regulator n=1 Tax=Hyphococcus luteus TaxID=2058213 RepID=A0A2S7K8C3_9PROT|nr:MarR family transcriptional regulator [Marinicaulis flavus]PQA88742.1 MarR family transcriptional regulator [Marinicaulis flavus]
MGDLTETALKDPLECFLGYQLRRVSAASMAQLTNSLARENFSPVAATVLLMIKANPGETQARIGRALAIKRANIAPLIAKLENEGLVTKTASDGRSYGLICTAQGKATARRIKKIMADHEECAFNTLRPDEQDRLLRLLAKARRQIAGERDS